MAVIKFGVKDAVGVVKDGGGQIERPPAGSYKGVLKRMTLTKNSKGDHMLKIAIQLNIKDKKLSKHDGYWAWSNLNLTDQGKGYVNSFLNALAGGEKAGLKLQKMFWETHGVTTKDKDGGDVTKIGNFNIGSPDGKRPLAVAITHRTYKNSKGEDVDTVNISRYMVASGADESAADDVDDVDDDDMDNDFIDDDSDDGEDFDAEDDDDALDAAEDDDEGDDGEESEDDDDDPENGDLEDDEIDLDDDGDLDDDADDLDDSGDDSDELAELRAELEGISDLKALRLKARDEFGIGAGETKGKSVEEVREMILDKADAPTKGEAPF